MHKCDLLLHCGSHRVPREELDRVRIPRPTATWQPIPHHGLLSLVERTLPRHGMRVVEQAHAITHDGLRYFGLLQIANGSAHPDYSWVLGLRNSHDKRLPAGLVLGSQVLVCDNLSFHGEITIARKHTTGILRDLPGLVDHAVARLSDDWHAQDHRIERCKETGLTPPTLHDLTIRALDAGVVSGSMVPKVLLEYRNLHRLEGLAGPLSVPHEVDLECSGGLPPDPDALIGHVFGGCSRPRSLRGFWLFVSACRGVSLHGVYIPRIVANCRA